MTFQEEIVRLIKKGVPSNDIVKTLGCPSGMVSYYKQKLQSKSDLNSYDWEIVQTCIDD
jgi:hypothetical protein